MLQIRNTAEITKAPLLSYFSMHLGLCISLTRANRSSNAIVSKIKDFLPIFCCMEIMDFETSKRSCFRRPCGNQRVNGFQTLLKSARHHYYPIFPCICDILSWKKSALVWSEILTLFVNTLTAHNKYSRCNVHNFAQQVQTPLSQK